MDKNEMSDKRGIEEMGEEIELTPEEKMAFQRLPKEAEPSDLLEERIVRSLKNEGLLGEGPGTQVQSSGPAGPTRGPWLKPWMAVAAVAASLALFSSGIVLGQWIGNRSTAQAFLAVREQDAAQLAMTIQEAGSQYVSALAALSELGVPPDGDPSEGPPFSIADLEQGQEVALGALYGAVYELARMSPDDMEVLQLLQILNDRRQREEGETVNARNTVWF